MFSVSSITRVFTIIDFKINQEYIAAVLCINKDKPASKCNGKCHLSKQLNKQADQEEKQLPQNSKEKVETLFTAFTYLNIDTSFKLHSSKKASFRYDEFLTSNYLKQIFHPPKVS